MTDSPARTCIDEAAILVAADPGAATRLRDRHRPRKDGHCAGCGSTPVHWPCVLVAIAVRAEQLQAGRGR